MATLPDINTSNVSFIGYWNAFNHGVSSITPSDVLSDSHIQSYTTYDNGIEGDYQFSRSLSNISYNLSLTFRVKNDGWFITYLDRSATYGQDSNSNPSGPWDFVERSGLPGSNFASAIQSLQSNLSNSGSIVFNNGDVGHYNFEYPEASTITFLHDYLSSGGGGTPTLSYPPTVSMKWAVFWAGATVDATYQSEIDAPNGSNTVTLVNNTYDGSYTKFGVIDALSNSLIPNPSTDYSGNMNLGNGRAGSLEFICLWE